MKIFHYDPDTYEYISDDIADPDPVDKGKWLIPAYTTNIEPLPPKENQIVCFIEDKWVYRDPPKEIETYDPTEDWTYVEYRSMEYPPISEYLDAVVKNDQDQLNKYINDCLAVKEKYPKPDG